MEWMLMPYKRYFDFSGRSRRKEYWMFVLFTVIIYLVLAALMMAGGFNPAAMANPELISSMEGPGALFYLGAGLLGLFALGTIIPMIAVVVRRLHDRDMSGWWYLGAIVLSMIPFVGFLVSIGFLVLMCLEGTPGPNKYGPDPKDPSSVAAFN